MSFSKHQRQQKQHARAILAHVLYGIKELVGSALSIASTRALIYAKIERTIWTMAIIKLPKAAVPWW